MWFDARAKLAEIAGQPTATSANLANLRLVKEAEFAEFAEFATPPLSKSRPVPRARADGLEADAGAYLDFLRRNGPCTYGAAASALGWGATRAWQAEARLRAAGLVAYHERTGAAGARTS